MNSAVTVERAYITGNNPWKLLGRVWTQYLYYVKEKSFMRNALLSWNLRREMLIDCCFWYIMFLSQHSHCTMLCSIAQRSTFSLGFSLTAVDTQIHAGAIFSLLVCEESLLFGLSHVLLVTARDQEQHCVAVNHDAWRGSSLQICLKVTQCKN